MLGSRVLGALLCAAAPMLFAACGSTETRAAAVERSGRDPVTSVPADDGVLEASSNSPSTTTTTAPTTTTVPPRTVHDTGFGPYADAQGVTLHHPAAVIERIGFHQAGHDGARQQVAVDVSPWSFVMEARDRGTDDSTAADIVVQPDSEIRAPVTGTVVRGGGYTLYCDHSDEYLVIEPDGLPGWEVKLLHFEGLQVSVGDRVEAGVTTVGLRGRLLPFESQVDEFTGEPSWPHVHIEVVDTSIPNIPSSGGGCS